MQLGSCLRQTSLCCHSCSRCISRAAPRASSRAGCSDACQSPSSPSQKSAPLVTFWREGAERRCWPLGSFISPDSPHLSGQCDNPERIALILYARAAVVIRSLDHDFKSDISRACTAWMGREHRRDRPQRNRHTPRRTVSQACSEEEHKRQLRAPSIGTGRHNGNRLRLASADPGGYSRTVIVQPDATPGRAHVRSGHMVAELAGIRCSREVAGKDGDSDRNSTP